MRGADTVDVSLVELSASLPLQLPPHSESKNRVTPAPRPTPDPWANLGEAQIREIVLIENDQFHDLFWDIYSFLSV